MRFVSRQISGYQELSNLFDLYIFDLCGVVHNGVSIHHDTVSFIEELRNKGKKIVFLSNSPNRSEKAKSFFKENSLSLLSDESLVTSGDFFEYCYIKNKKYQKSKFYYFGSEANRHFLDDLGMLIVSDPSEADYFIASPFSNDEKQIKEYVDITLGLVKFGKEYLCINPDIYAPHGDHIRYTPGYFAKIYSDADGKVKYFGKPEKSIYEFVIDSSDLYRDIPKNKIVMIGDSMNTDVRGAKNFGIKSLLVGGGYHQKVNFNNAEEVEVLFGEYGFQPDYYVDYPRL